MIKFRFILPVISCLTVAVVSSCEKQLENAPPYNETDVLEEVPLFRLSVSSDGYQTRTTLGDSDGSRRSMVWCAGDRVSLNGTTAYPLAGGDAGASSAEFLFPGVMSAPYTVVYPFSSFIDEGTVRFPSEQISSGDNIAPSGAIMAGQTSSSSGCRLYNLCGFLKINLTSTSHNGHAITSIAIVSRGDEKLSGNFRISYDGEGAPVLGSALEGAFPRVTLRQVDAGGTYIIAVPAQTYASGITLQVKDNAGHLMQKHIKSSFTVEPGIIHSLPSLAFVPTETVLSGLTGYSGTVRDDAGAPLEGIAVNDGTSVAVTDADGRYVLPPSGGTPKFIWYTIPSDYAVPYDNDGYPAFWKRVVSGVTEYDFTLTPLPRGKETSWMLNAHGDPQVTGDYMSNRLANEMGADMKAYLDGKENVYSIALGDLVWDTGAGIFTSLHTALSYSKTGAHFFTIPGNHDYGTKDESPTIDYYHSTFGPDYYSFDRGDMHVIALNDVIYSYSGGVRSYVPGITDVQYNWLVQDLARVPKTKGIILCVHIGFRDGYTDSALTAPYFQDVIDLISEYASAHILSGHLHFFGAKNHTVAASGNVLEYSLNGVLGVHEDLRVCNDGSPRAYYLFSIDGTSITNLIPKAIGYPDTYQIRAYDGNQSVTGDYMDSYGWEYAKGTIVANVFTSVPNRRPKSVELWQNGSKCCNMTLITASDERTYSISTYDEGTSGPGAASTVTKGNNRDWWVWFCGGEDHSAYSLQRGYSFYPWHSRSGNSAYQTTSNKLYKGMLSSVPADMATADFEIRVTDYFGNSYTCSTLTSISDISEAWRLPDGLGDYSVMR